MGQDNTLDVISEIEESINHIWMNVDKDLDILDQLDSNVTNLVEISELHNSAIGLRQQSFNLLNTEIAKRINDVEIGITDDRAKQLFGGRQLEPIIFEDAGITVKIEPHGLPRVNFPSKPHSIPYFAEMLLNIGISISGQEQNNLVLIQRLCFTIKSDGSIIPVMLMGPRFLKEAVFHNPFLRIPIKKQKSVRKYLMEELARTLESNTSKFDQISLGAIKVNPNPYTYFLGRKKLVFMSKALPKRKNSEPLLSHINPGYNQALKIKKNILEKEIRRQISSRAVLNSIQFKNGFIRISTSKSDTRRILHIKVTTWARIDYRLFFTVSDHTNLLLDARWAEWEYKINAKRCWPICDKVIGLAKSIVLREIGNNKYFTQNLANLWRYAYRIRTRVTPFGIQLDMKVRT